ncbi:MAG: cation diffusion facilitator family transporter [Candidatus Borkfalkiaceae bacterium]|nr:cation diffusion facilitator family transporter [Christensenellaceae bacterium]
MFNAFVKLFIKDHNDADNPEVRRKYGKLLGFTGIFINLLLSASKIVAGVITGAISVLSDGVNNLSDAGTSLISLFGFKLSSKKPDKEHPFGHGRFEYFAGLAVSVVIMVVAFQLFTESVSKIISNETSEIVLGAVFYVSACILVFSVLAKFFLAGLNRFVGRKINSVAVEAAFMDSVSDCISTAVVLICLILSIFFKNIPIDGYAGVVVSLFIAYTGIKSMKEVADVMLGKAPDAGLVKEIADYVKTFDDRVVGIHDLMLHDYGPGRKILVLHVEVPAEGDIMELHDMIDNIERGLESKFNCIAVIHMDPVVTTSARVNELKEVCRKIVKNIDESFDIHDFRMNEGETHANLIFDVLMSYESRIAPEQVEKIVSEKVKEYDSKLAAVVKAEYPLV